MQLCLNLFRATGGGLHPLTASWMPMITEQETARPNPRFGEKEHIWARGYGQPQNDAAEVPKSLMPTTATQHRTREGEGRPCGSKGVRQAHWHGTQW